MQVKRNQIYLSKIKLDNMNIGKKGNFYKTLKEKITANVAEIKCYSEDIYTCGYFSFDLSV